MADNLPYQSGCEQIGLELTLFITVDAITFIALFSGIIILIALATLV